MGTVDPTWLPWPSLPPSCPQLSVGPGDRQAEGGLHQPHWRLHVPGSVPWREHLHLWSLWLSGQAVGPEGRDLQADLLWTHQWHQCHCCEKRSITHDEKDPLTVCYCQIMVKKDLVTNFCLPLRLSSFPAETPSSPALTTAAARCTTCALTRRSTATRTAAWTPASHPWRCPTRVASSLPATMTSTATSGTHWRERKLVSGLFCSLLVEASFATCGSTTCYVISANTWCGIISSSLNSPLSVSFSMLSVSFPLSSSVISSISFLPQVCCPATTTGWAAPASQMMVWASAQDPGTAFSNCGTKASQQEGIKIKIWGEEEEKEDRKWRSRVKMGEEK